jgi:hypothetical protein
VGIEATAERCFGDLQFRSGGLSVCPPAADPQELQLGRFSVCLTVDLRVDCDQSLWPVSSHDNGLDDGQSSRQIYRSDTASLSMSSSMETILYNAVITPLVSLGGCCFGASSPSLSSLLIEANVWSSQPRKKHPLQAVTKYLSTILAALVHAVYHSSINIGSLDPSK